MDLMCSFISVNYKQYEKTTSNYWCLLGGKKNWRRQMRMFWNHYRIYYSILHPWPRTRDVLINLD